MKQGVKHFQSLFYKNKPVLPWYSVAPHLPFCPIPILYLELWLLRGAASHSDGGCWCCTLLQGLQASTRKEFGALLQMPPPPRIQVGNCPKMPPRHSAIFVQGASLRKVTYSTHFEKDVSPAVPFPCIKKQAPQICFLPSVELSGCHPASWLSAGSVGSLCGAGGRCV